MGRIYRDWVRENATAKRSNRAVLNVLADFAKDETGIAFPSYTTLADATGLSERTIMRCINSLVKDGDLERIECKTGRGNKQGLKIIKKGDNKTQKGDNDDKEKGDNCALKGDNCAERVTTTTEKGDNDGGDTIYGTVLEPDLEPRENRAREDRPTEPAQPPAPPLGESDIEEFVSATNIQANALSPLSGAPPSRVVGEDPPSGPKTRPFDPRELVNDFWPEGTGQTPYEVYRESFAVTPSRFQIKHMNANVTDLDKWRQTTQRCALKGFKSYDNVFDVYQNGFRKEQYGATQNAGGANQGNPGRPAQIERRALGQPPGLSRKRQAELFEGLPLL